MTANSPTADAMEPVTEVLADVTMGNMMAIAMLAGAVVIAVMIHAVIYGLLSKAVGNDGDKLFARAVRRTRTVSRIGFGVLAIELVLPLVDMPDSWRGLINQVVTILLIGIAGWLLNRLINAFTENRVSKYDLDAEDNLEARKVSTRMRLLSRMMTMLILLVTVAAMLMTFPSVRSIGISLFASAGVAGIVIGFAARPVLSNLIAGIQIALTQPLRIGDAVIMKENGAGLTKSLRPMSW
ncbi:MAG: hypothetical protein CMK03_06760 [Ponticaulis sp.]|nr:hypothetical protein [Ponticaulis sp.]